MENLLIIYVMILLSVLPHITSHECNQPVTKNFDVGRGDDIKLDVSFVANQIDDDNKLSLRSNTSGQTLPPCNNTPFMGVKMKVQPCWFHVSSGDERDAYEIMIRHQASSEMYSLEYTFRNGSVCRFMEINVTVHEKDPICTTIYTPMNNTLRLYCEWNTLNKEDKAQLMIGNHRFTGNVTSSNTTNTKFISSISTMISLRGHTF